MVNQPFFKSAEKRFGNSVVPAIAIPRHALNASMLAQALAEIFRGILDSELHFGILEKMPTAFFKMSRSNSTSLSRFLSS
jgi:hypothetical protein